MRDTRVAKRYAAALFETARDYKVIESVEDDLKGIVALIRNDERFKRVLQGPDVAREQKLKLLDKLFSDRVTAITMQALRLILEKGRETEIEEIQREFVRLRREHEHVISALITTAEALEDDQRARVVEKLAQITARRIEPEFRIEPHLIGGISVAYENHVLDGSLHGQLRRLREKLVHDVLKQS